MVPQTAPTGQSGFAFNNPGAYLPPRPVFQPAPDAPHIAVSPWTTGSSYDCIRRAGGIPTEITSSTLLSDFEKCTGLLIPGGRDVDPATYGQEPKGSVAWDRDRDEYEITLIKYAMRHKMAILGICRGHQLLNVALGGTLIQDMHHSYNGHQIRIDPTSRFFSTVKGLEIRVNSLHHQTVDKLGRDMVATAWAPDNHVEIIEHTKRAFVLGVQFHPEMEAGGRFRRACDQLIWNRFIRVGREKKARTQVASAGN